MFHEGLNLLTAYHHYKVRKLRTVVVVSIFLFAVLSLSVGFEIVKNIKLQMLADEKLKLLDQKSDVLMKDAFERGEESQLYYDTVTAKDEANMSIARSISFILKDIPPGVQLEGIEISQPNQVVISGKASSGDLCLRYYQKLTQNPCFQKVTLDDVRQQVSPDENQLDIYTFSVQATIVD